MEVADRALPAAITAFASYEHFYISVLLYLDKNHDFKYGDIYFMYSDNCLVMNSVYRGDLIRFLPGVFFLRPCNSNGL